MKIGFIGAGNMASAIIRGVRTKDLVKGEDIFVSNPSSAKLEVLKAECGVNITNDNKDVVKNVDMLFLCVKPQMMDIVIEEIKNIVNDKQVIVTIAAGKSLAYYAQAFGRQLKLIRVMPNTPALVGAGISAVCPNVLVSGDRDTLDYLRDLLSCLGEVEFVKEDMIDIVGQIAGAASAWISMIIEAMADGAVYEGMSRQMAYKFASAGVAGAGKQAYLLHGNPSFIKDMCASPKGTTIEGIKTLEERGVRAAFMDAVIEACEKSKRM